MTSARIQKFCKNHNIFIGSYDGSRINPRSITERNIAIYICIKTISVYFGNQMVLVSIKNNRRIKNKLQTCLYPHIRETC